MALNETAGPAFPVAAGNNVYSGGMTLRDWFAGQALAGMAEFYNGWALDPSNMAEAAFAYADAMLASRKGGAA